MQFRRSLMSPFILAVGLGLATCGGVDAPPEKAETRVEAPAVPVIEPWGYPLDALDRATTAGDDFFRFANGGWLDATPIPSDRDGTGFSIIMLERNEARMAEIISSLQSAEQTQGSDGQKIRDLYASFMNEAAIEDAGMAPFEADLAKLEAIDSHEATALAMGDAVMGIGSIFGVGIAADSKLPTDYTVYASQSGLGLPDRSYYLRPGERLAEQRAAYQDYMATVFTLLGGDNSEARAAALMQLETDLADLHWSRADRRDATRTYNPMPVADLDTEAAGFPW